MAEPLSAQAYIEKFHANQKIEGFGIDKVTIHVPCPFCAEPDFMLYTILEVEKALEAGATCKHCNRGSKAIIHRENGGMSFEMVQTCGDEPSDWLVPKMRRIDVKC